MLSVDGGHRYRKVARSHVVMVVVFTIGFSPSNADQIQLSWTDRYLGEAPVFSVSMDFTSFSEQATKAVNNTSFACGTCIYSSTN